jgi:hypothetical protein
MKLKPILKILAVGKDGMQISHGCAILLQCTKSALNRSLTDPWPSPEDSLNMPE